MRKQTLKFLPIVGSILFITGCIHTQPFIPKALNEDAKGITTVRSTPYGCKVLGEVEGKDAIPETSPNVKIVSRHKDVMREGALNDLRNNAVTVTGKKNRITLRIIDEKPICRYSGLPNQDCPVDSRVSDAYIITAQIFECGEK
ncbi:hypothetical protein [Pelistega ratti]|uniref:hypothetical protein n=1 Tax=Pelistega ratti TaxID=2652177 RepID=UPI00135AAFCB|nr:hypothetical protein [Pelistega ratti]